MKKIILLGVLLLTGMLACNKNDSEAESMNGKWTLGKKITVEYNNEYTRNDYTIDNGQKRLFEYNHSGEQSNNVYDDEWSEELKFTIDENVADFELTDEEILEINCFYQEFGAWVRHNQYQIKDGKITGKKISTTEWKITVDVLTTPLFDDEQPKRVEFTAIFTD